MRAAGPRARRCCSLRVAHAVPCAVAYRALAAAKPQFAELWDSLIEQYREDLEQIAKTVDVPVPSSGDVLKQITEQLKTACEAKFEEIDRKYERRLLALAQPK